MRRLHPYGAVPGPRRLAPTQGLNAGGALRCFSVAPGAADNDGRTGAHRRPAHAAMPNRNLLRANVLRGLAICRSADALECCRWLPRR
jgi:hypothetical protein